MKRPCSDAGCWFPLAVSICHQASEPADVTPARQRAARAGRCGGGRAVCESQHPLDAPPHVSRAIAGGMPIEIAQQNLGHASLATTTVYVTTEKRRRMQAVEAFWRK